MLCPRCQRELYWRSNDDFDLYEDEEDSTEYSCVCGVTVTVPWENYEDDEDETENEQ